jgi:hypothetical protein
VRSRLFLPLIALAALAAPAAASADTYCVPAPSCSPGTPEPDIATAVNAADTHPGPDTVSIGPGTFSVATGVTVAEADTSIVGSGMNSTIVTGDAFPEADPGTGRILLAGPMARLADLTLRLPSVVTSGPSSWTGAQTRNLVENVRVDDVGATFGPGNSDGEGDALDVRGGTLRHVVVALDPDQETYGVRVSEATTLEDLDITASTFGINSDPQASPDPQTVTAHRVVIHAKRAPLNVADGFFRLSDAVLDTSAAPPPQSADPEDFVPAVQVFDGRPPDPAGVTMDRVTVIGNGHPTSTAISIAGQSSLPPTFVRARHLLAANVGRTVAYQNYGTDPIATIDYSAVDPAAIANTGPNPSTLGGDRSVGNRAGNPLLGGDLMPALMSPAVDIGGDDLIAGDPTDLRGNPRPVDGNGDGSVLNDAGALERQYAPDGATVKFLSRKLKLNRRGVGKLKLSCPAADEQPPPCQVDLRLTTAKKVKAGGKKRKVLLGKASVTIGAGETKAAKFKVARGKLGLLRRTAKARKAIAGGTVTDGNRETSPVSQAVKVKPKRR